MSKVLILQTDKEYLIERIKRDLLIQSGLDLNTWFTMGDIIERLIDSNDDIFVFTDCENEE